MATVTINTETVATSAAAADKILLWVVSGGVQRAITKANFMGGVLTGAGTVATGGFTLTVPATGTAALLGGPQTFTGAKTFDALITSGLGINFGDDTLQDYDEGTWTPAITFGNLAVGLTMSAQHGYYTRIGNLVFIECDVRLSAKGSSTGTARITGLPFAAIGNRSSAYVVYSSMTGTWKSVHVATQTASTILAVVGAAIPATSSGSVLSDANFSDTSILQFCLTYRI
jgi:hypothetical protein